MYNRILIVLGAEVPGGTRPFDVLDGSQFRLMHAFKKARCTTRLEDAIESVREPEGGVLVVGPAFLKRFPGGKESLKELLLKRGIPQSKIVFSIESNPGMPLTYEHLGKTDFDVINMVLDADLAK